MRILYNRQPDLSCFSFQATEQKNRPPGQDGLSHYLTKILNKKPDTGDLILLAIIYLIYADTKDEDFLFLLIALFFCL